MRARWARRSVSASPGLNGRWRTPAGWAVWVAPCPFSQDDLVRRKQVRHRKARMDSRTRARLPVLPVLVQTTNRWRRDTQALLAAGRQASLELNHHSLVQY